MKHKMNFKNYHAETWRALSLLLLAAGLMALTALPAPAQTPVTVNVGTDTPVGGTAYFDVSDANYPNGVIFTGTLTGTTYTPINIEAGYTQTVTLQNLTLAPGVSSRGNAYSGGYGIKSDYVALSGNGTYNITGGASDISNGSAGVRGSYSVAFSGNGTYNTPAVTAAHHPAAVTAFPPVPAD